MLKTDFRLMVFCAVLSPLLAPAPALAQFCRGNSDCGRNYFCPKFFDACEGVGYCTQIPRSCNTALEPVCGCDGETYANRCLAAQSGTSVDYQGPCNPGCQSNAHCPFGLYCEKSSGNCASEGVCKTKPSACFTLWSPVCGCNQKTYSNACVANQVGVSVAYAGECDACGRLQQPGTWPTSGYYLEMAAGDSMTTMFFHIWVTSATGVAHIEQWLASNPTRDSLGIPGAPIELVSTTNPGYSYRMVPDAVEFGQRWIETCDGTPCFVEDQAQTWDQWWCPWNARPVRVWHCDGGTEQSCGDPVF